jgi:hypothetical protein
MKVVLGGDGNEEKGGTCHCKKTSLEKKKKMMEMMETSKRIKFAKPS